jgi:thiosulfate dehydrogenase [quinone] large subunit
MDAPVLVTLRREPGGFTRSLTALVLRLALGVMFVMAGLGKFEQKNAGTYPGSIVQGFEGTWMNKHMPRAVKLYADALPYVEVGVGALLIAGLATTLTAFLTGLLLVSLLFGLLVQSQVNQAVGSVVPTLFGYILADAAILWLSPVTSNYLSIDGLLVGWFWKPRSEGEFRREVGP